MNIQMDRIQLKKGLYLTGIASSIIVSVFTYQWVTGMQLDTGEILSVPIALGAFLSLFNKYRKLSLT
ncbi:hypothetical protein [Brevibacillus sp. NRS-1366]|uniref:hypothetical protein n=1 Tax=Brevibacillus sp. NRS-1366 TaxID=3233899 RepID=UPI003D1B093E